MQEEERHQRRRRVARAVPPMLADDRQPQARAAAERIRARAQALSVRGFDWESLKKERDTGRP